MLSAALATEDGSTLLLTEDGAVLTVEATLGYHGAPIRAPRPALSVEVRDANLATTAIVDSYTSLTMVRNWMATGTWVLTLPTQSAEVEALLAPGAGIILRDGDTIIFSGPADTGPGGLVVCRRELTDESDTLTVTGADDMVWLGDRLAHPSPLDANPATQDYDINTGPASSVAWEYVDDNTGPGAVASRRTPLLVMAPDPGVGVTMTQQARWQNLLVFLRDIAIQGGVTVEAVQVARQVVVTVAATVDRSAGVVLSTRYGDLANVVYEVTRSTSSAVYMGAQGDLSTRVIREAVMPGVRRVESFADRRDVADPATVNELVAAALADVTGTTALTVTPSDTDSFRFGVDYKLGDFVRIGLDQAPVTARVSTITTVLDVNGMTRTIAVGDIITPIGAIYAQIRNLSTRLRQLERS